MGRNRSAFTLVELMVVLVLIGIMTAMIVPEMKGSFEDALLRSTGRKVVAAVQMASSQAIARQEPLQLRFDRQTGRYLLERSVTTAETGPGFVPVRNTGDGEGKWDPRIILEIKDLEREQEAQENEEAPEDLEPSPQMEVIRFFPDGTADPRLIQLRDRDGFGLVLRLNPTTSRVFIGELERK